MKPACNVARTLSRFTALSAAGALALLTVAGLLSSVFPALAQTPAAGAAKSVNCVPRPGMLGVARKVEIDTTGAPKFGLQQYKDHDFLRDGEIVLTFDDGPLRRHSRMVLDALTAHCTQATFFLVGQMAVTDPDMVREMARHGHTIAIHTWSHQNLRARGTARAIVEIELGISAVQRALGEPVAPFFRFPYLADSQGALAHLAERNFGTFSIDVDSADFRTHDPRRMQKTVLDALASKKKGIVLAHDIQFSTANGIKGLLDELAQRGFKIVHLIPKTKAKSLPSYDAMAEAEFSKRNKTAAANPMAPRSVVWPLSQPNVPVEQLTAMPPGAARPAQAPRTVARPVPAATEQPLPPVQVQAPLPPKPVEQPLLRGSADDDWRQRVFGQ